VAAAGVAGLIKMVMAMRHGMLPPTLHAGEASPHVDWSAGEIRLLTEPEPWEAGDRPRRAAVSSFGISGTNAHVILEEPPADGEPRERAAPEPGVVPWLVSAKSEAALRAQAERLRAHVQADPELEPLDVAFTLATARAQLERRAAVVGSSRDELLAGLETLVRGEPGVGVVEGAGTGGKTAFMFTGQGAQRVGMGRELYEAFPAFAEAFDAACAALGDGLKELIFEGNEEELARTENTQSALFAIEVALFRLLESLGLKPDFLIGHSIGELAAAHVAGVLSLEDACKLVAARGKLMGALPEGGAMLAIEATEEEVSADLDLSLSIAAVNGPRSTVVSGDADAIDALDEHWQAKERRTSKLRVSHAFHSQLMEPMLDEFRQLAESLTFNTPQTPIVSNLTGGQADEIASADYWVRHVREPVRFMDGIRHLEAAGVTRFLELGPDGVLSGMAAQTIEADDALLVPTLREDRPETEAFTGFLAAAHVRGANVDWTALLSGGRRVDLPTYAFQRQRFWLAVAPGGSDLGAAGLGASEHPLLGASLALAGEDEWLFTGRLSLSTQPWLADHVVLDSAILPGTAFVELALAAGAETGCESVEDLTLEAPLVLREQGGLQLQLTVGEPDESGRRQIAVYSRPDADSGDGLGAEVEWSRHASGTLAPAGPDGGGAFERLAAEAWPPQDAEPVRGDELYDRLADLGYAYGPVFQGVRTAWMRGDEVFAEIALGEEQAAEAGSFGLHPALFDAALHPGLVAFQDRDESGSGALSLPFSWGGVTLRRTGASALRVHMGPAEGDGQRITAIDEAGDGVLFVDSLVPRTVEVGQLEGAREGSDSLFALGWPRLEAGSTNGALWQIAVLGDMDLEGVDVERFETLDGLREALAGDAPAPDVVLAGSLVEDGPDARDGLAEAALAGARGALGLLQGWIADERLSDSRLVLVTRGAAAVGDDAAPDPAAASLWGHVRSAQAEHPGRFVLVDVDGGEVPWQALLAAEEPQLAVRDGGIHVPRLERTAAAGGEPAPLDPEGTVLITGGTGGLGALLARHLAREHGARRLLLVSRSGPAANGVEELQRELGELGCEARVEACDVGDRDALGELIDSVPEDHPLTAVIHAAGVIEDGVIESLDGEQLERVMRPKVDAAVHLHELTEGLELSDFVLFSSAVASLGSPGQGNYSAANAFLDALAQRRRSEGLAGRSLAWGMWGDAGGMAGELGGADVARARRFGIAPLSSEQGLELFDAARGRDEPLLIPARLDGAALRAQARAGMLPALLRGLVRVQARREQDGGGSLSRRLAAVPQAEWEKVVLELVRGHVATVLGEERPGGIEPERAFKELGFDSLAAVELRNRLIQATGLRLPSTLVFDHPTSAAVAKFLLSKVDGAGAATPVLDQELDKVESMLAAIASEGGARDQVDARLRSFRARLESFLAAPADGDGADEDGAGDDDLEGADDDKIFEILDELGTS
jgi:malonyl CoA-acyl carrier protein transacylase